MSRCTAVPNKVISESICNKMLHPFILADQQNSQPKMQNKKKGRYSVYIQYLHWGQQCSVWYKVDLNILMSVQVCCALSSRYGQIMPYQIFTASQKFSQWTCVCLHKATSEAAWLLRSGAHSLVHTCRSEWTWLLCRNALLQGTGKGPMRYVCAVAHSTARQCTRHSNSAGKLWRYGSLRRTAE